MQEVTAFQWMSALIVFIFGLGGMIRGFQMSSGRLDLISDWENRQLPNPEEHAPAFARVYIRLGGVIFVSPITVWFGLPLLIWWGLFAVLVWYWFKAIDKIAIKAISRS